MDKVANLIIIFPIAITLHNIEEALWLPKWSQFAKQYHKPVDKDEFHFALICVTLLAYLSTFSLMFFNDMAVIKYIYFGYVGTMVLNAIFPHLAATIVLKRYAPGVITGMLMNLPCFSYLIVIAIMEKVISPLEMVLSTVIVAGVILASLPILFNIGRRVVRSEEE